MKKALGLVLLATAALAAEGYHVVGKIHIGGPGGWDYLAMDTSSHRLFVSNSTRVVVVDVDAGKVVGEIPDTQGVHGIAFAPSLNRGFTSNGRANTVTIFDLKTLQKIGEAKAGTNPDAIAYEPKTQRVFTFNGRSGDSTAIDAKTGTVVGTFALGGKPEFAVVDGTGKIYDNLEDKSEIVEIDAQKMAVLRRFPLAPCESPSGLAIDTAHHKLFSVCENKMMAVTDYESGKVVATAPIGSGPDAAAFDPGAGIAFSSNSEGTLTLVRDVNGKYEAVDTVNTERSARTMTVDPKTHRVYLSAAEYGPMPASAPGEKRRGRPPVVADSFHVLVVGK
ncbi:MAG TPA: YncE family protein [Bryobacteraceae bacterium]|nr:YncE family protein [Bryobacteraceae bacterium]